MISVTTISISSLRLTALPPRAEFIALQRSSASYGLRRNFEAPFSMICLSINSLSKAEVTMNTGNLTPSSLVFFIIETASPF